MTERPNRFDEQRGREEDLPPEADNSEQDHDADDQAQTVADQARGRESKLGIEDSKKVSTGSEFDDVQDLVDKIAQMDSSGRIDMDAYRGEPNHDDNVDKLGDARKVDPLRGDGT
jgi:sigma54-dependent transcription regulator